MLPQFNNTQIITTAIICSSIIHKTKLIIICTFIFRKGLSFRAVLDLLRHREASTVFLQTLQLFLIVRILSQYPMLATNNEASFIREYILKSRTYSDFLSFNLTIFFCSRIPHSMKLEGILRFLLKICPVFLVSENLTGMRSISRVFWVTLYQNLMCFS